MGIDHYDGQRQLRVTNTRRERNTNPSGYHAFADSHGAADSISNSSQPHSDANGDGESYPIGRTAR